MELNELLTLLTRQPDSIVFSQVIETIDENYHFTPTEFKNGKILNAENQNNGSCKIFAFAQLQQLDKAQTLACFGDYYRKDVLQNPEDDDHQNIRNFIEYGWDGIQFSNQALSIK
ncbi:HopJ type III effector protein [Vibrio aestuarianus]|uniref:HopJ type III effector protein n=1 Tax=Vibrio aestuarianus TaxID=28171 RepID=A0A9X4F6F9_9VIBR|nr:HopJ type III effector protein [Vibrio aestuarianus]MDE1230106.1 HopJ type III effector protein [Vibrio aestuarianus]MDE1234482.1 HopJ type III effector protein [Vibrio aestuarianus]MDE1241677.1 HopJ type III effector protein [Vibrio aestuarianus]MDE1245282.1 HopJ type III effector protein [Vibrio aestuarianus]MDE1311908.1 HopJ type III effector protein [Vibrio aestuarianus]